MRRVSSECCKAPQRRVESATAQRRRVDRAALRTGVATGSRVAALFLFNAMFHHRPQYNRRVKKVGQALLGNHQFENHAVYLDLIEFLSRKRYTAETAASSALIGTFGSFMSGADFTDPSIALHVVSWGATFLPLYSVVMGAAMGRREYDRNSRRSGT